MLLLVTIGAMLRYPRPEPWKQPVRITADVEWRMPRPLGPRRCPGDA